GHARQGGPSRRYRGCRSRVLAAVRAALLLGTGATGADRPGKRGGTGAGVPGVAVPRTPLAAVPVRWMDHRGATGRARPGTRGQGPRRTRGGFEQRQVRQGVVGGRQRVFQGVGMKKRRSVLDEEQRSWVRKWWRALQPGEAKEGGQPPPELRGLDRGERAALRRAADGDALLMESS